MSPARLCAVLGPGDPEGKAERRAEYCVIFSELVATWAGIMIYAGPGPNLLDNFHAGNVKSWNIFGICRSIPGPATPGV